MNVSPVSTKGNRNMEWYLKMTNGIRRGIFFLGEKTANILRKGNKLNVVNLMGSNVRLEGLASGRSMDNSSLGAARYIS